MIGPSAGGRLEPSDPKPGHRPVLRQGLDEQDLVVRRHHVVERGRAGAVVGQAAIDLVGDDPEPMRAGESERRREFLARGDEAGRIGRGIQENNPRRRGHGGSEPVDVEAPAALPSKRNGDRARAGGLDRADEVRPGGGGDQRLLSRAEGQAHGDLDRMHAADGGEEAFRPERAAGWRRAVNAGHVGGDRLAKDRDSALVSIKRLAPVDRRLRRLGGDRRRRQVALADPERDEALPIASVIEHFDDAARGGVADRRLDFGEPVAFGRRGDGHGAAFMDQRMRARKRDQRPPVSVVESNDDKDIKGDPRFDWRRRAARDPGPPFARRGTLLRLR